MQKVRVRFAPSPTGMMHLGNVRAALINFLFAHQKSGTFVLRIEDTDAQRMFDPEAQKIIEDLHWLGLSYNEGPHVGGAYAPYYQSARTNLYQKQLTVFKEKNLIYRCFCTEQELEKTRLRQQALKLPPRYDRTCMTLTPTEIEHFLNEQIPYIWRFKCDHNLSLTITDFAYGNITFDMSNFSDFAITRQDGSFTFIFANFVDDYLMDITHIFRGADHLSNTANQAALFHAINAPLPTYWHLPILVNLEGKKLSKRDFGFSLRDLKDAGFLPEAVANYVSIVGGSFKNEIMNLDELAAAFNFDNIHSSGHITYDVEKLKWVNKSWINRYQPEQLTTQCLPALEAAYGNKIKSLDRAILTNLIQAIKSELTTTTDVVDALKFYFTEPQVMLADIEACISQTTYASLKSIITEHKNLLMTNEAEFASHIKLTAKNTGLPLKELFWFLRLAMMGKTNGPGIHELVTMLGGKTALGRIENALNLLS
ncbi:MAG TPA: glutamate--tRNA ligase [Candidatus Babeliales bacterium]|jgi:nondiscriminating glutamyl-tRNA synthetase|nr:glutamate--tRNA ligase [Candidatus Babeliales bacterium]